MIKDKKDLIDYLRADSYNYSSRTSGLWRRIRNDLGVTPISEQKYIWLH